MSAKQAINDKLQGNVATYLRCGAVVNKQIKKELLLSRWVNFFRKIKFKLFFNFFQVCLTKTAMLSRYT